MKYRIVWQEVKIHSQWIMTPKQCKKTKNKQINNQDLDGLGEVFRHVIKMQWNHFNIWGYGGGMIGAYQGPGLSMSTLHIHVFISVMIAAIKTQHANYNRWQITITLFDKNKGMCTDRNTKWCCNFRKKDIFCSLFSANFSRL